MDVNRAIKLAQALRSLILQGFKADKDDETYEKSDQALEPIEDFFKENTADVSTTHLLAQIDKIIYTLISYEDDGWHPEDNYQEKTLMKLKEIIKRDSQFRLKNILIPAA
jgi:hypothetical protein